MIAAGGIPGCINGMELLGSLDLLGFISLDPYSVSLFPCPPTLSLPVDPLPLQYSLKFFDIWDSHKLWNVILKNQGEI